MHTRATANALAKQAALHTKQAALHAVDMLKGGLVNQFTADQLGSTSISMLSTTAAWQCPALSFLFCTHELPPHPATMSHLCMPTSPSMEMHSMAADGAYPPFINLSHTPVADGAVMMVPENLMGRVDEVK
jgi:hypothetical protein